MVNDVPTYKGFHFKSKNQHTGTRSASVQPPVFSPNSILPPTSSHCAFIPGRKKWKRFSKMFYNFFAYNFQNLLSLKLLNLKACKKEIACNSFFVKIHSKNNIVIQVLISPQPDLLPDVFCLVVRIFLLILVLLYIYKQY